MPAWEGGQKNEADEGEDDGNDTKRNANVSSESTMETTGATRGHSHQVGEHNHVLELRS